MAFTCCGDFFVININIYMSFPEKLYKEPAVRVPSLSRLSEIAKGLGLNLEEMELMAYRGEIFLTGSQKSESCLRVGNGRFLS